MLRNPALGYTPIGIVDDDPRKRNMRLHGIRVLGTMTDLQRADPRPPAGRDPDRVYPRDSDMVSCHNDLKPENMLVDGDGVWLVDWEAAFLNDRYHDLAMVANFVVTNDAEEEAYLRAYFGEAPGEYRLARFYLMRQTMHLLYVIVFMLYGSGGARLPDAEAPPFRDFHNGIWAGEIGLASDEVKSERVGRSKLLRIAHDNSMTTRQYPMESSV